jgi:hypothetical protein
MAKGNFKWNRNILDSLFIDTIDKGEELLKRASNMASENTAVKTGNNKRGIQKYNRTIKRVKLRHGVRLYTRWGTNYDIYVDKYWRKGSGGKKHWQEGLEYIKRNLR